MVPGERVLAEWEKRRDASEGVSGWMGRCIGRPRGT